MIKQCSDLKFADNGCSCFSKLLDYTSTTRKHERLLSTNYITRINNVHITPPLSFLSLELARFLIFETFFVSADFSVKKVAYNKRS